MLFRSDSPETTPTFERKERVFPWPLLVVVAGIVMFLLLSIGINGDGSPLAPYIRFLGRGVLFGLSAGVFVLLALAAAIRLGANPPVKLLVICGFVAGVSGNALITWRM